MKNQNNSKVLFVVHEHAQINFFLAYPEKGSAKELDLVQSLIKEIHFEPELAKIMRQMSRLCDEEAAVERPFVEVRTFEEGERFDAIINLTYNHMMSDIKQRVVGLPKYDTKVHIPLDSNFIPA